MSDADRLYYLYGEDKPGWYHTGVDVVAANANTGSVNVDVYSLYGGKVISIENQGAGNGAVGIYNEFLNVTFFYLHMITDQDLIDKFNAAKSIGDDCLIEPGTRIGTQSDVGPYAEGSTHLHFEVRTPINIKTGEYNTYAGLITETVGEKFPTILPYGYMNGIF